MIYTYTTHNNNNNTYTYTFGLGLTRHDDARDKERRRGPWWPAPTAGRAPTTDLARFGFLLALRLADGWR